MKIKNIVFAFKDQLPVSRFIRNMWKGHLIGLLDKRSHYTKEGKPKVTYNTKATAIKSAAAMMKKNGTYYSNYKCLHCDGYHIGRNSENK
tara:strand:+ start:1548 stop:1817 length:270 start_codon:yes stop_codon:yes gene_type:complete